MSQINHSLSQLIIVLKYFSNKIAKERCIGLINISENKGASFIAEKIINLLQKFKVEEKLYFQCYDGAPVMSGSKKGVQAIIMEKYKNAKFIHCYAHKLNLIADKLLKQSNSIKEVLQIVDEVIYFFAFSPKKNS